MTYPFRERRSGDQQVSSRQYNQLIRIARSFGQSIKGNSAKYALMDSAGLIQVYKGGGSAQLVGGFDEISFGIKEINYESNQVTLHSGNFHYGDRTVVEISPNVFTISGGTKGNPEKIYLQYDRDGASIEFPDPSQSPPVSDAKYYIHWLSGFYLENGIITFAKYYSIGDVSIWSELY